MLKIFDQHKNPLGYITKYTDLCIESDLFTGDKTLSFTYRAKKGKDIQNEFYVETKEDRYVVKEVGVSSDDFDDDTDFPGLVPQTDLLCFRVVSEHLEDYSLPAYNVVVRGIGYIGSD